jgi:hypothetical protein
MLALWSETILLMSRSTPGTLRWMFRMRCVPFAMGSSICGKLTAPVVAPALMSFRSAPETSRPIASWASSVEPPMWGVRMTLGRPRSADSKPSLFASGSSG